MSELCHCCSIKIKQITEDCELRKALEHQIDRWNDIPMGIDEEADEHNTSPDDATAHIGGLAVKEIKEALSSTPAPEVKP